MLPHAQTIDPARVLGRLRDIATIGALDNGGVCRLAFSPEETQARLRLIAWAQGLGCVVFVDEIGNLFLRFGSAHTAPVLVGSHLDTQPIGGNYDGVLGVIAALESVEVLAASGASHPVEIAIWSNEEGARFNPTTMGSAVHAGHLALDAALAARDADGQLAGDELKASLNAYAAHGITLLPRALGGHYRSYVELHIEQGPILEGRDVQIGIVTDVQGLAQFRIGIAGTAGHAGAVPMGTRDDALTRAREIMAALDNAFADMADLRHTIGQVQVAPGAINTIPAHVAFTLDMRHPDAQVLAHAVARAEAICAGAEVNRLIYQEPVPFAAGITDLIEKACAQQGLSAMRMASGATHDAVHMAALCPTGMIFVPCKDGISHNENEYCKPEDVVRGTQVLADVVFALARCDR